VTPVHGTIVAFALALLIPPLVANTLSVVITFDIVPIMPKAFAPIEVLLVRLCFPLAIGILILCMLLIMLVTGESI